MSTGAQFYRQEHAHRSIVVSTGALFCLREHCFVDRSIVLAAEALFCPSLTGALFGRHEHCFVDRSMVLSTGAMPCRPEHRFIDRSMPGAWGLPVGRPAWGLLGRPEMLKRLVFAVWTPKTVYFAACLGLGAGLGLSWPA